MKRYFQWRAYLIILLVTPICAFSILWLSGKVYVTSLRERCSRLEKVFREPSNQAIVRLWAEKEIFSKNFTKRHLMPVSTDDGFLWPEEVNAEAIEAFFDDLPIALELHDFDKKKPTCVCIRSGSRTGLIISKLHKFDSVENAYQLVAPDIAVFCLY
jgi:hypothetical protein